MHAIFRAFLALCCSVPNCSARAEALHQGSLRFHRGDENIGEAGLRCLPLAPIIIDRRHTNPSAKRTICWVYALQSSILKKWSGRQDSNLRHPAPKAGALPDCATPRRGRLSGEVGLPSIKHASKSEDRASYLLWRTNAPSKQHRAQQSFPANRPQRKRADRFRPALRKSR